MSTMEPIAMSPTDAWTGATLRVATGVAHPDAAEATATLAVDTPTAMSSVVATRAFGNTRSGANLVETVFTQASVRARGLRKIATAFMPGDARGTEGTSIIAREVTMPDGLVHDVLIHSGMGGYVCAWDARTALPLWQVRVANPVLGTSEMDTYLINDHWGSLSTPVLDPGTGTIYLTTMHSPDGAYANAGWAFVALDVATGAPRGERIDLSQASYQPPGGLPLQRFGGVERKQRCALTLTNVEGARTVFIGAGSFNEDSRTNQGWVIAVNVTTDAPAIACAWASSARYGGSGIWMAGQGLCADERGFVGGTTGNGAFDGVTEFGELVFRLRYTPPREGSAASLACESYLPPFTDTGLVGGDPTLADTSLIPGYDADGSEKRAASNMNGADDEDLGSSGVLLVTQAMSGLARDVVVFSGKHGILYIADWNALGSPAPAEFAPARIEAGIYAKFLARPIWGTYFNPDADPAPVDLATLPTTYDGKTHHMHSTPVFYRSRTQGPTIFLWGENSNLRAFRINTDFSFTYLGCSAEVASVDCGPPGGMPGGMLSLSANGDMPGSAVLWALIPYGDANKTVGAGRMLAYDPENFGTYSDGNGAIKVLWDSEREADSFVFNKFDTAVAAGGVLYRPNYDGTISFYALG